MYTKEKDSVRTRLLEGALSCLREKGYADTTARDVAAAADANLRSIGYHFGSMKGLLLAAISLNFRRWLEPLIDATTGVEESAADRLRLGMTRFTEALTDNTTTLGAWLDAVALAGHDAELRAELARNQAEFRAALARTLVAAGDDEPDRHAAAIVTVCDGVIVRFLLHREQVDPREVADDANAALAGLFAKPGQ
jgi:AcrR family transcriptional regulator